MPVGTVMSRLSRAREKLAAVRAEAANGAAALKAVKIGSA